MGEGASMRPGRMPRKYRANCLPESRRHDSFNEAGADAPEIPTNQNVRIMFNIALQ